MLEASLLIKHRRAQTGIKRRTKDHAKGARNN